VDAAGCAGRAQPCPGSMQWCPEATLLLGIPGLVVTEVTEDGDGQVTADVETHPGPTRTAPARAATVTVTVCPGRPEPLRRTLLPKNSLASKTASSSQGCPGPSTAHTNARTTRVRSVRPQPPRFREPSPHSSVHRLPTPRIPGG
jgi:hypothetical protein